MTNYNSIRPILLNEADRKADAKWKIIEALQEPLPSPFGPFGQSPNVGSVDSAGISFLAGLVGGALGSVLLPRLMKSVANSNELKSLRPIRRRRRRA